MESEESHIKEIANKLVDVPGIAAVILYGSYARGDFDEGSDVDLFILFDSKQSMREGYENVIKILSGSNLFIQGNIRSLEELKNLTRISSKKCSVREKLSTGNRSFTSI